MSLTASGDFNQDYTFQNPLCYLSLLLIMWSYEGCDVFSGAFRLPAPVTEVTMMFKTFSLTRGCYVLQDHGPAV